MSTHVRFVVMNLKYNQFDCVPFLQQYSGADWTQRKSLINIKIFLDK